MQEDGAHDGEELAGGGDRRAHQRVKVADGVVDEVLAERGRQREAQHVRLPDASNRKTSRRDGGGGGGEVHEQKTDPSSNVGGYTKE